MINMDNITFLSKLGFSSSCFHQGPISQPVMIYALDHTTAESREIGRKYAVFTFNNPAITDVYPRIKGVRRQIKIFTKPPSDKELESESILYCETGIQPVYT